MWLVYYCFSNSTSNCLFLVKLVMVPWCILGLTILSTVESLGSCSEWRDVNLTS
jgi:hypothetical protein